MQKQSFKDIDKLLNEATNNRYVCKCGHSLTIYPFEHRERKLCNWCGHYVYTNKEEQKKYDFRCELNERIKEKNKNGN